MLLQSASVSVAVSVADVDESLAKLADMWIALQRLTAFLFK